MKRFDLRYLKDDFYNKMFELFENELVADEVAIVLFEIGDFSHIQKSSDLVYEAGYTLMNSIKFSEVDWTIVVKKAKPQERVVEIEKVEEENKDEITHKDDTNE